MLRGQQALRHLEVGFEDLAGTGRDGAADSGSNSPRSGMPNGGESTLSASAVVSVWVAHSIAATQWPASLV